MVLKDLTRNEDHLEVVSLKDIVGREALTVDKLVLDIEASQGRLKYRYASNRVEGTRRRTWTAEKAVSLMKRTVPLAGNDEV